MEEGIFEEGNLRKGTRYYRNGNKKDEGEYENQ